MSTVSWGRAELGPIRPNRLAHTAETFQLSDIPAHRRQPLTSRACDSSAALPNEWRRILLLLYGGVSAWSLCDRSEFETQSTTVRGDNQVISKFDFLFSRGRNSNSIFHFVRKKVRLMNGPRFYSVKAVAPDAPATKTKKDQSCRGSAQGGKAFGAVRRARNSRLRIYLGNQ